MFVGALYFLESLISMQSLTDSDKNSIFDAMMTPCGHDSLYLHCSFHEKNSSYCNGAYHPPEAFFLFPV